MKKYELVFGDMSQFEGMMPDCEFVDGNYGYKNNGDIFYYCERYNEKFGWAFSHKTNVEFRPIAMRRITEVPTWTRADKEAGKLPPVGALCVGVESGQQYEVMCVTSKTIVTRGISSDRCHPYPVTGFIRWHDPIETPEEKAQRLEDEFIESFGFHKPTLDKNFVDGMRFAYRKLKASTNE